MRTEKLNLQFNSSLNPVHSTKKHSKRSLAIVAILATGLAGCGIIRSSDEYSGAFEGSYDVTQDHRIPLPQGRDKLGKPYTISGNLYTPEHDPHYHEEGIASWYGEPFHGRKTANGEIFDMNQLTAAHRTLPIPSYARVTNLENGKSLIVRVNDRGPFAHNRIIDLSKETARELGMLRQGTATVRVRYLGPAENAKDTDRSKLRAALRIDRTPPKVSANYVATHHDPYEEDKKDPNALPMPKINAKALTSKKAVTPKAEGYATDDGFNYSTDIEAAVQNPQPVEQVIPNTVEVETAEFEAPQATETEITVANATEEVVQKPVADSPLTAFSNTEFFIQAGAFSDPVNALKVRNLLKDVGSVEIAQRSISPEKTLYVVRVGPYNDRNAATKVIAELKNRVASIKPFVVAPK